MPWFEMLVVLASRLLDFTSDSVTGFNMILS